VNLLLDTHVWFWAVENPSSLGRHCRAALESPEHALHVATVSVLEFGQLESARRILFRGTLESWVRRGTAALGLQTIDLSTDVALLSYALPGEFHKDPADRVLVATAVHHGFTLITADARILAYPKVLTLDARR